MNQLLKDKYPEVASIDMELTYRTDAGTAESIFESQRKTLSPESIVPDIVACRQRECINGGFYIGTELQEAIRNKAREFSGRIVCQGWLDRESINHFHCLYELHFSGRIEYRNM